MSMCKIPGFQDLAESIFRIQGQKKNQGPFPRPKTKIQEFFHDSRTAGYPAQYITHAIHKSFQIGE